MIRGTWVHDGEGDGFRYGHYRVMAEKGREFDWYIRSSGSLIGKRESLESAILVAESHCVEQLERKLMELRKTKQEIEDKLHLLRPERHA